MKHGIKYTLLTLIVFLLSCSSSGKGPPPSATLNFDASRVLVGAMADRIASSDFNRDGKADILVSSSFADNVGVLLGNGDGTFQTPKTFPGGPRTIHVAVSDFDDDTKPDLVVVHQNNNEIEIRIGNGDGTFQPLLTYPVTGGPYWAATGDFNMDARQDIAVATSSSVSVLLAKSGGIFWPAVSIASGLSRSSLKVADFNNDSIPDLVVSNFSDTTITVIPSNGNGTFATPVSLPSAESLGQEEVFIADLDGDGLLDAVTTNGQNGSINVLLGMGDGAIRASNGVEVGTNPYGVAVADFDGDGKPDIVTSNNGSNDVSVLHGNGNGTFAPHRTFAVGREPVYLVVGDWNKDGKPDIAVALAGENAIGLLMNASAVR